MVKPPFTGFDLLGFTQMCHRQHSSLVELRSRSSRCSSSSRSRAGSGCLTVGQSGSTGSLRVGQSGSTSSDLATVELSSRCSTEDTDSNAFLTPPTSPSSPTAQQASIHPHMLRMLSDQTPTQSDDEVMATYSKERRVLRRWVSEEPTSLFRTSSAPITTPERPAKALPTFSMDDLTRHLAEIYLIMGEPVDPRVWEDTGLDSPRGCDTPNSMHSNDEAILRAPVPYGPPPPKPPRLKDRVSCLIESNNAALKNTEGMSKSLSHLPNNCNSQNSSRPGTPGTVSPPVLGGTLPLFPSERQRGVEPYQSPFGSPKAESFFTKLKKQRNTLRRKTSKLGRNLTIGHPSQFQHLGSGIESLKNVEKDEGGDSVDSLSHEDEDDSIPEENSLELSKSDEISSDDEKDYKDLESIDDVKKKDIVSDSDDCESLKIQNEICNGKRKVDSNENLSDDAKHEKAKNR
ncbi:unnamed protein product [Meganyctiphanes norvegica]|uniref:Uncharacterized protein n=1 Tax=Meganyctiphanes norvegica TaxID=48144 RepID=A0AAV2Q4L3_MEGNR